MPKYKTLVEFDLEGVKQAVDSVVELTEEAAAPLVEDHTVELAAEQV